MPHLRSGDEWVRQTVRLVEQLRLQQEDACRRAATANGEAAELEQEAAALSAALAAFQRKRSSPVLAPNSSPAIQSGDDGPVSARSLCRPSTRDLVLNWARAHGGRVALQEIVPALVTEGFFDDGDQARKILGMLLARMPETDAVRVERGIYRVFSHLLHEASSLRESKVVG